MVNISLFLVIIGINSFIKVKEKVFLQQILLISAKKGDEVDQLVYQQIHSETNRLRILASFAVPFVHHKKIYLIQNHDQNFENQY
jgi:hypothetical protein